MNTNDDPLAEPSIAVRIFQREQRQAAASLIIVGVMCFIIMLTRLTRSGTLWDQINAQRSLLAMFVSGFSVFLVGLGIKYLIKPNPLVTLVLDLSDRVRKLEGKN